MSEDYKEQETQVMPAKSDVEKKEKRVTVKKKTAKKRATKNKKGIQRRRLSGDEKIKIMELLSEGKAAYEISALIDRPETTVINAITALQKVAVKAFDPVAQEEVEKRNDEIDVYEYIDTDSYNEVVKKLEAGGVSTVDAKARINKVCLNLRNSGEESINKEDLFNACLKVIAGAELFRGKSEKNGTGVAILTPAASEVGDASKTGTKSIEKSINNKTIFGV